MSPFLKLLLGKGDGSLLKTVKETVDEFVYSKEEKAEAEAELQKATAEAVARQSTIDAEQFNKELEQHLKFFELEVADKKSARERETSIAQAAPSKLWGVTVNVNFILALLIIVMTFILHILKGIGTLPNTLDLNMYDNVSIMIVSYYFGSSSNSKMKDDTINSMSK